MLKEYKRDYEFDTETRGGEFVQVHVTYYYPGTSFPIDSTSLEPNDPEEIEYDVYQINDQGEAGEALYDEDEVYDPEEIIEAIRNYENCDE